MLALTTSKEEEDNRYVSSNKWITFHYVFFLVCLVLPCILSHPEEIPQEDDTPLSQIWSYYRVGCWMILYLVYIWTLVASRVYPEQDFSTNLFT